MSRILHNFFILAPNGTFLNLTPFLKLSQQIVLKQIFIKHFKKSLSMAKLFTSFISLSILNHKPKGQLTGLVFLGVIKSWLF